VDVEDLEFFQSKEDELKVMALQRQLEELDEIARFNVSQRTQLQQNEYISNVAFEKERE
jgi:hypothetical protein